ncbi:MAG: LCP family protein [Euzebyales bacterium]|nr:LCP family protein [Euzebyales bacterium]
MRRVTALLLAVVLTVGVSSAVAVAGGHRGAGTAPPYRGERVVNILLLGSDVGPPHRPGNPLRGRADAIHVVAVDTRRGRATIVDIPRDSYIAGDKVNAHMAYGGPARMVSVLEDYSGLEIDYWAVTSFAGLRGLVRGLGGVRLTVDRALPDQYGNSSLRAGRQRLDGFEALHYSRARKSLPDGDFGRTRHQGQLLRSAHRELRRRRDDPFRLTRLLGVFARNTETNIPARERMRLAVLALRLRPEDVRQVPLSGAVDTVGGASIVRLSPGDAFRDIREGRIGR